MTETLVKKVDTQVKVLVLAGRGLNCEEETAYAFTKAGAFAKIINIDDLVLNSSELQAADIFVIPGGFSYGDDTGSANALAQKIANSELYGQIKDFIDADKLVLGICNGFQTLLRLGFLGDFGDQGRVSFTHNDSGRYIARWVDLKVPQAAKDKCVFLKNMDILALPIAHGEGKIVADEKAMKALEHNGCIAMEYVEGEICQSLSMTASPNGGSIAGIINHKGNVLGTFAHAERAVDFLQHPLAQVKKEELKRAGKQIPQDGSGQLLFNNALEFLLHAH